MKVNRLDTFSGHREGVYTLAPSANPNIFYSAGADGLVIEWDLNKPDLGRLVARTPGSVYALNYESDTSNLWIGQNFQGVRVIDPTANHEVGSLGITQTAIFDLLLDQELAYVAQGDGVIAVMDRASFEVRKHIKLSDKSIRALAKHPTANFITAATSDHTVYVLDSESHRPVAVLKEHTNSVFAAIYAPDGSYLLTAGRDASFCIWHPHTFELIKKVPAHMYAINHIAFHPEGTHFATCSMDKSIKIWDAQSFKLLKVIDRARHAGHGTSVNRLLWIQEGILLSASDDRMISVWEIAL